MRNFSICAFCLLLLAGCGAGYRSRLLLNDAENDVKLAETYEAWEYTPYEYAEALERIQSGWAYLQKKKNKQALASAQDAKNFSIKALRLSLKSVAAVSLKEARDAISSVEENRAFIDHEDIYRRLVSETERAEKAFIADQLEQSVRFSRRAVSRAATLLNPLIKEAEMTRERVKSAWTDALDQGKKSVEIEALIQEGEEAFQSRHYGKAVSLWNKAEKELRFH